jgi:ribose transport system permease protein
MSRFLNNYGMLGVLILLAALFSILTLREQQPEGISAANSLAADLIAQAGRDEAIAILAPKGGDNAVFAYQLHLKLTQAGFNLNLESTGDPATLRTSLEGWVKSGLPIHYIATLKPQEPVIQALAAQFPELANALIVTPAPYRWPTFLLPDNLRNVANQITVIAIIAIGMSMVIITAGIDLSVGSLVALSAVVTAWLIGALGGETASVGGMIIGSLGAILLCGLVGAFSGLMITRFRIPSFIATLAMMQVAAGVAYIISQGKPIYRLPESFIWLGRGAEPWLGLPNAVILMVILYAMAHVIMSRTTLGRYIYAVGGNEEAARLAGIRVKSVLMFVYAFCGMLAGLGGVIMASQLKSGAPTYGVTYELYVIAAVVVGGTSLSGGEGRILGTLIGAFIIGVIQNGMNLTNVESYTQKVVLGLVILGAVLLDRFSQARKNSPQRRRERREKNSGIQESKNS